jgi:hypothetical protein
VKRLNRLCWRATLEARYAPAIKAQALGEGLRAHLLEKLNRYETHLDRKFERNYRNNVLAMLCFEAEGERYFDNFDIDATATSTSERAFLISMGMTEEEADAELNASRQAQPGGVGEVQAPVDEAPAAGPGEGGGKGVQGGEVEGAHAGAGGAGKCIA